jgi:hypothetical protein
MKIDVQSMMSASRTQRQREKGGRRAGLGDCGEGAASEQGSVTTRVTAVRFCRSGGGCRIQPSMIPCKRIWDEWGQHDID